jgi:DNA-binding XRE family transcriptional regulator
MKPRQVDALIDPRDGTVRYVGVSKEVQTRLAQHIRETQNAKREWLSELKESGLSPEVEILETIEMEGDIDTSSLEREQYWINALLQSGAPLTNISGIPRAQPRKQLTSPQIAPQPLKQPATFLTLFEKARFEADVSIKQLAKEARISVSTIYKMEKGEPVKIELAVRACRVLSQYLGYKVTYQSLHMKTTY